MLTLDCIRHGKTRSNQDGRYNGASEESLTREQFAQLAAVDFDSSTYDAVFCSPRKRCVETATQLRVSDWQLEPRIVERSFGVLEGLTQNECRAQYPAEFAAFRAFDQHYIVPSGESRGEHHARMIDWICSIERFYRNVLTITHGGMIDLLYRLGAGEPLYDFDGGIKAGGYAALSRFEIQWPRVRTLVFRRSVVVDHWWPFADTRSRGVKGRLLSSHVTPPRCSRMLRVYVDNRSRPQHLEPLG